MLSSGPSDGLVSQFIQHELLTDLIKRVEIEAVASKATQVIACQDLQNDAL